MVLIVFLRRFGQLKCGNSQISKMAAILKSCHSSHVNWRHQVMLVNSKEKIQAFYLPSKFRCQSLSRPLFLSFPHQGTKTSQPRRNRVKYFVKEDTGLVVKTLLAFKILTILCFQNYTLLLMLVRFWTSREDF